jgi:methyl-accepting chemotaxis protein
MTQSTANNRRGNYFILKGFQTRFILRYIALVTVGMVFFSGILYLLVDKSLGESLYQAHLTIQSTGKLLLPYLLLTGILSVVVIGVGAVLVTLYISHKIAGPLYRIQTCIDDLGNGDLTVRAKLRTHDQLILLAESFNHAAEKLATQVDAITREGEKLDELVRIVQEKLDEGSSADDVKGLIYQTIKAQQRLREKLSLFRLG